MKVQKAAFSDALAGKPCDLEEIKTVRNLAPMDIAISISAGSMKLGILVMSIRAPMETKNY
jgi:hypothetical protein